VHLQYLLDAFIFSLLGMFLFVIGFFVVDKLTPYELWKEIVEQKNIALAIVVGSVSLGLCIIIASAIN
jgi:putative membrane protein